MWTSSRTLNYKVWLVNSLPLFGQESFTTPHFRSPRRQWSETAVFLNSVLVVISFSLVTRFYTTLDPPSKWHLQCSVISPFRHWLWSAHLLGKKRTVDKLRVRVEISLHKLQYQILLISLSLAARLNTTRDSSKYYPDIFIPPSSQCWLWLCSSILYYHQ